MDKRKSGWWVERLQLKATEYTAHTPLFPGGDGLLGGLL